MKKTLLIPALLLLAAAAEGFRCEGLNAASSAQEKERFANLKAERYWMLRERFLRGEVSGLTARGESR